MLTWHAYRADQVTRKIKRNTVKTQVNHAVAQRLALPRFGKASNEKENATTTTVGENFRVKLQPASARTASKQQEEEDNALASVRDQLKVRTISCRLCSGGHYTSRCPYKDTLQDILPGSENDAAATDASGLPADASAPGAMTSGGKYIPPSMRAGGRGPGESMFSRNRDDLPTLRVTNLSEDVIEDDLWLLFGRFAQAGRIHRIFVGRDQETGLCKGFAFVSFEDRGDAEKAMGKINGMPYGQSRPLSHSINTQLELILMCAWADHLILACAWSLPRGERAS